MWVVLLAGSGRAFCAGGDIRSMTEQGFDGGSLTELAGLINRGQLALLESSIPVVAAAHGSTAGGGLGILLTSDYAVVGRSSKIGCIYAKVGLTPDLTVSALLARAVGERRALQLVVSDRMLSAQEALDWGSWPRSSTTTRCSPVPRRWRGRLPIKHRMRGERRSDS